MEKEMVLDPSTGEMVTAPGVWRARSDRSRIGRSGGSIPISRVLRDSGSGWSTRSWASRTGQPTGASSAFDTLYLPEEALTGQLAESWETPDPLTYVFKIRDGVFWHDKAPVNGRQLTAHDVEYTFHRVLGLSGGEPSPIIGQFDAGRIKWESITATDDFTVEFKLSKPTLIALKSILSEQAIVRGRPRGGRAIR